MQPEYRDEFEIFSDLEALCTSPGYVHAIAYFCFRDNTVGYANEMQVENLLEQYAPERLVRPEISTLIGLACKGKLDITLPPPEITQKYIDETEKLLNELHQSMLQPSIKLLSTAISNPTVASNPLATGVALREPIFYSGEAAYSFQYRDLPLEKYKNDSGWFTTNKGYSIQQAVTIISAISRLQDKKTNYLMALIAFKQPEQWPRLPVYTFTIDAITVESKEDQSTVKSFINSFIAPKSIDKSQFKSLGDFNPLNAYPIIQISEGEYLLFQSYSLAEALYETPFFWLIDDKLYKDTALKNRGAFTESFCKECLTRVFGENRVFTNVNIYNKKTRIGEIDVLVIFADRAIVVQAKSKKLTIEARKGNDNCLKDDFKKAVQDAYDQAFQSATFLNNQDYILVDADGNKLDIPRDFREIYPFCVVSEHYPSLNFQVRQFLQFRANSFIMKPFVMDVFFLDVLSEILQSPLHFLSYVNRRVQYGDKVFSGHELTVLSFHLKNNLWIEDDNTLMMLDDDIGADIDLAMLVRRDNVPGKATPTGILTKYQSTFFGRLIAQIDRLEDPGTIGLGFMLLQLSGETIESINKQVSKFTKLSKRDKKHHDFSLGMSDGSTGLTIHCNHDDAPVALDKLKEHCLGRKYVEQAKSWFGLSINPFNCQIKVGVGLDFDWTHSEEMDKKFEHLMNSPRILWRRNA